ncbi:MAG: MTH1187 family thiamine-binding protein [Thermodesulfobacteriota bacterium]
MAILQLTIIPLGTATTSVGDHVAQVQRLLEKSGVDFQLNDMGTLIEGDIDQLLAVVRQVYDIPFNHGAQRVVTQMVIDDRRDKEVHIGDKINFVQERL